jgi:hypothetical protein
VYPGGKSKFWGNGFITEDHEKYIKDEFFEFIGSCNRFPMYKNKRGIDPQVKIFIDQEHIEIKPDWNLPVPNQDAAYKSLGKYGKSTPLTNPEMVEKLNRAWSWMARQFSPYMQNARVVSLSEAVDRLDMSTSSGCPFNELYITKRELFENDSEIRVWLEKDWELLATDYGWTTIFSSSLKEELRTAEKIAENSIRTFAAGATDATVHGNRLFVDMNEKLYDSHLKSASTVGMSPLKGNWDQLYRKLNVFPNGYALDESQYDSSLRAFLMWGCAKFRYQCLCEEDQTSENLVRIQIYYRNLVNTMLLTPEGILIMKKLGNPSGSVNTVSDNTLILYWLLAYAWIETSPNDMNNYASFEEHTAKALLGDDNTWTVSDEAHKFYNAVSVIESWKPVGIITTTDSLVSRPADELDFLSAHTVFLGDIAVPLYDRNKLMQALFFAPQKRITPETTLQRVTNLMMIGWTDIPFRKFCRALINWLLSEYDHVLKDDPRWIIAKSGIKTDDDYYKLFTGRRLVMQPQYSQSGSVERSETPDKTRIIVL